MSEDGLARHTPLLSENKAVRMVTCDTALLLHVGELIGQLTREWQWFEDESSVADVLLAAWETLESWYSGSMIGQIANFISDAPPGWLELDGATYDKVDYPELWEKMPAAWQTPTQFTLPDFEDIFTSGVGSGGTIGATGGANSYSLDVGQLPSHTHTEIPPIAGVDVGGAGPPLPSATIGSPIPSGSTGDGDSIDNRPLFLALVVAIYAGRE